LKGAIQLKQEKQMIARKKYQQLLTKINFFNYEGNSEDSPYQYTPDENNLMPFLFFFKYLSKRSDFAEPDLKADTNRLKI